MSGQKFDVTAALKEYPESEVAAYLAQQHGVNRDAYIKEGLTDADFLKEYGAMPLPSASAPVQNADLESVQNEPFAAAGAGAILGGAALAGKKSIDIAQAINNFGKGAPPAAAPLATDELSAGQKWASKTGFGSGTGETVEEVDKEYKRIKAEKEKPVGRGKVSSKITGGTADEIIARANAEDLERQRLAQIRAEQKIAKETAEKAAQKTAAVEKKFNLPNKLGTALPVAGAGMAYNAQDTANQAKRGDYGQAAISATGAAGSAAPFIKKLPPKARALGFGASLLAPILNRGIDAVEEKAKGGLVGLAGGGKLEKAAKLAAKFIPKETKVVKASEALGKHEGKKLGLTQTDNFGVHGGRMGGNRFPDFQNTSPIHQRDQVVWMNDSEKHAQDMINRGGEDTIWSTYIGAPDQLKSNKTVFNDVLQQHYKRELTPEQIELINNRIATLPKDKKKGTLMFPQAFDIRDKFAAAELGGDTFDRRAALASMLGEGQGVGRTKQGIAMPEYQDILRSHRDPLTEGVPTSSVGTRLFNVDQNTPTQFSQQYHPDYNWTVHGKDTGVQFERPIPQNLAVPDWYNEINARAPGKTHGNAWFSYMKNPQQITEEYLTRLQKEGYATGGLVSFLNHLNK